jgi:hypothetical protein
MRHVGGFAWAEMRGGGYESVCHCMACFGLGKENKRIKPVLHY